VGLCPPSASHLLSDIQVKEFAPIFQIISAALQVSLPLSPISVKSHWAGLNIQFGAREIQSGASPDAIVRNMAESKKSRTRQQSALNAKKNTSTAIVQLTCIALKKRLESSC
jgi:hypothetical protein